MIKNKPKLFLNLFYISVASIIISVFLNAYSRVISIINNFVLDKPNYLLFIPLGFIVSYYLIKFCQTKQKLTEHKPLFNVVITFISHFVGASVGKEGVGIEFAEYVGMQMNKLKGACIDFKAIGKSAGFASLFASPIASICFAIEKSKDKKLSPSSFVQIIVSSVVAFGFSILISARPFYIMPFDFSTISVKKILTCVLTVIVTFGFSFAYSFAKKGFKTFADKKDFSVKFVLALVLLCFSVLSFYLFKTREENGISVSLLFHLSDFDNPTYFYLLAIKALLTIISLAIGFKGGEFVPLIVCGALIGGGVSAIFGCFSALCVYAGCLSTLCFCLKIPFTSIALFAEIVIYSFIVG